MRNPTCSSIKDSFMLYLAEQTVAHEVDGECILTVPMNTVDNRWVDITVESSGPDFFVVHDSGKSSDELYLQGVAATSKRSDLLKMIANRFGVDVVEGRFVVGSNAEHLQHSIWAVAHCSGLAMAELLRHRPNVEDEAVKIAVGGIITSWAVRNQVRVQSAVSVRGETTQHTFDFVAANENRAVAVNVLLPSSGSLARAQRYGFQKYDTRDTYKSYKNLAILADPDVWSAEARGIVGKMADRTVEFVPAMAAGMIADSLGSLLQEAA